MDRTRFGYTSEQWQAAVEAGRTTLVGVAARRGGTITYTELCNSIKAHSGIEIVPGEYALPYLLGDICDATLESDDIAITTLVTYQGSVEAGSGLFDLAVQRGLLPKNPTPAQKDAFRIEHMNRAYDRWERRRRPGARYRGRIQAVTQASAVDPSIGSERSHLGSSSPVDNLPTRARMVWTGDERCGASRGQAAFAGGPGGRLEVPLAST